MFPNKTKDNGDTCIAEIRTNFVPVETEVDSSQPQKTNRLNMPGYKCPLKIGFVTSI